MCQAYTSCTSWIAVMSNKLDRTELSWGFRWVLMWQGELPCRMTITKCGSVPCWAEFRINMQPEIWCSLLFRFKFLTIMKSGSEHSFPKTILWQSGSRKLDVLKWGQLHSSQSGWFLRQPWCHEPGNPLSFHATVSDKHAVRVSTGFCKALILKGLLLRNIFGSLRSAAFDCHESQIYRETATFVDPSK